MNTYELIAPCHFGLESVLKREILGQTISTTDIMQILITNLDESIDEIKKSQNYISKVYQETYGELPYWTE